jgi:hypothetical protein
MRLQLVQIVTVFALCVPAGKAEAQEDDAHYSEGRLRIYADDDHVTVVSPSVAATFDAMETLQVDIAGTIDVVSAASVDVITQASPAEVHEVRVEGGANFLWALLPTVQLRTGGIVSHESDYDSLRPTLGGRIEVAQRNATIDLSYTAAFDKIGLAMQDDFAKKRRGHILAAGYTQILDEQTYLDTLIDLRRLNGFHANPYRMVPIVSTESTAIMHLDEQTPALRQSVAGLLGIRRAIASNWFLHASLRLYQDDWSVGSQTLNALLLRSLAEGRYLVGWRMRGYAQSAADFYRPYYEISGTESAPEFRTRDRSLGTMRSIHGSLTIDAALSTDADTNAWRLRSMASVTHFSFLNFPAQRRRNALILGLSLLAPL